MLADSTVEGNLEEVHEQFDDSINANDRRALETIDIKRNLDRLENVIGEEKASEILKELSTQKAALEGLNSEEHALKEIYTRIESMEKLIHDVEDAKEIALKIKNVLSQLEKGA